MHVINVLPVRFTSYECHHRVSGEVRLSPEAERHLDDVSCLLHAVERVTFISACSPACRGWKPTGERPKGMLAIHKFQQQAEQNGVHVVPGIMLATFYTNGTMMGNGLDRELEVGVFVDVEDA